MEKGCFISFYLDTRRELKSKKYPVKLRVFTPMPRKQKLYPTKFEFTETDFKSTWEVRKVREAYREKRRDMQAVIDNAEDIAGEIFPFSFEEFERRLYLKSGDSENVFGYYQKTIERLKAVGRIGTSENYKYSLSSLKNYLQESTGREPDRILFREITPTFLSKYEYHLLKVEHKSPTTVGIYLRPLRALFNSAIADRNIKPELYPFGKRLYQIPSPKAVKKALTKDQLQKLYESAPKTPEQQKAKDFWFFLYNSAGMNVKDLAALKYENLHGDSLIYIRQKTQQTSKSDLKPVVVYLNAYAKEFIAKYGNPERESGNYIFAIFEPGINDEQKFQRTKNFTKFINQNLKKFAKSIGLPEEISTYWSRHSFATNAVRSGASLEQISQALNHHNMSTTKGYFAGFEDESMKKLTDNLMDFN
jgi:site-specific recombinase XerD